MIFDLTKTFKTSILLLVYTLTLSNFAFSQKIEKYYSYNWKETEPTNARFYSINEKTDSGWRRTDYFLATKKIQMVGLYEDSLSKIGNGNIYYFYANGKIEQYGRYEHGRKQGLWLIYHENGMMADSSTYLNGHPINICMGWHSNGFQSDSSNWDANGNGISFKWHSNGNISSAGYFTNWNQMKGKWQFFDNNGKISSYEFYDSGKLISKECFDSLGNKIAKCQMDKVATFKKGTVDWNKYLGKSLFFPSRYKFENTDAATVVISFVIDENGNIEEAFVKTPLFKEFDEIALRAILSSPKWEPAIEHNRNVKSYLDQPIMYQQQD